MFLLCFSVFRGPFETKLGANASYSSPAAIFTVPRPYFKAVTWKKLKTQIRKIPYTQVIQ